MSDEGLSVLMLPDYTDSNPYQSELIAGLERRNVGVHVADSALFFPVLRECRARGVPDVVHLHWAHRFVTTDRSVGVLLLGLRLLFDLAVVRLLGARVVWTVHNCRDHECQSPGAELLIRHCIARLCTGIVVHCESARGRIRTTYRLPDRVADRIRVVPHGNYLDAYDNEISLATARRQLDLPADATVFLYFGLIRGYKNVPSLIETFGAVDDEDARLLVVGNAWSADIETDVRSAAAEDDRVRPVLEYVPGEDIQLYMNAADAVVLPFDGVLTSGTVLLGMSFGRALILPNVGCPPETVGSGGGLLYEPSDPDGLRTALRSALDADTDLAEMGERNLAVARQLDWDAIAARTRDVYLGEDPIESVVSEPPGPAAEA